MIPKKIHYCWFSKDPYPALVQACIASWKKYMPDWEYVLWDYEKVKDIDSIWLKECLEAKKWAFATDFIRLWAVYHEGGVYLDSDVMIYQSLNAFLRHSLFIGREGVTYATFDNGKQVFLTSHCFGAEAGHPFLKLNLGYYQDRHFDQCSAEDIPNLLKYDMLMMPYIQSQLAEKFGYNPSEGADYLQELKEGIVVYPSDYFGWDRGRVEVPERYAEHLGQGSWREPEFWKKHDVVIKPRPITFAYKIRWRMVSVLRYIAKKMDYGIVRLHPDGRE